MPPEPGSTFTDLALPDHNGRPRTLSGLVEGDPAVLHTFRGPWCPKEQRFFDRLLALQDEMEVAYSRMISLSVDPPEVTSALRAALGARWTFLCDPERVALERLDLRETTDTTHDPYVPAVFVLAPDLTIHARYDGYWYWGRPTVDELVRDLRAVTREIRADWAAPVPSREA